MANAEQLALLKAGVEGWNKWREDNADVKIDFSFSKLPGAKLSDIDLTEAELKMG